MKLFLDTSALLKLFIEEAGRDKVIALVEQADQVAVASICLSEAFAVLNRLKHEKRITARQYTQIKDAVLGFSDGMDILELDQGVISRSIEVSEKFIVKGMDAIHVATALNYKADGFVSADRNQTKVSAGSGLHTVLV